MSSSTRSSSPVHGLYAIAPVLADTRRLAQLAAEALEGGAQLLQYRGKELDRSLQLEQATELARLCRSHGIPLIVNDDVALAAEVDAAGVHLGRDDGDLNAARALLGPGKIIGASCYDRLDLAVGAAAQGADYVAFGSFFASPTKPHAVRPPLELIGQAKGRLTVPVVAIGGITPENARLLIEAGVDAVAVISALFEAPSVREAAQCFSRLYARPQNEN